MLDNRWTIFFKIFLVYVSGRRPVEMETLLFDPNRICCDSYYKLLCFHMIWMLPQPLGEMHIQIVMLSTPLHQSVCFPTITWNIRYAMTYFHYQLRCFFTISGVSGLNLNQQINAICLPPVLIILGSASCKPRNHKRIVNFHFSKSKVSTQIINIPFYTSIDFCMQFIDWFPI